MNDREQVNSWASRFNWAAHELARIGRHTNTWELQQALAEVGHRLGSGSNPDEVEVILRALLAPVPEVLPPPATELSFRYLPGEGQDPDRPPMLWEWVGVEITHLPTGLSASSTSALTRGENSAAAAAALGQLVEDRRGGPLASVASPPGR